MTSADPLEFSHTSLHGLLFQSSFPQHISKVSPGKSAIFLSIYPPHLHEIISSSYRTLTCLAALSLFHALYVISVRRTRDLPTASFRFHLTMDTLAFGYILPTTGRIQDLHLLETCAARRTL